MACKVMTLNVYTDVGELPLNRIDLLKKCISSHLPDIFFLQEAALKQHRTALQSTFASEYHLLFTNHMRVRYRWKSYVPFLSITWTVSVLLAMQCSFMYWIALQLIGIATLPFVFLRVMVLSGSPIIAIKQMVNHELCRQGLVVGIRRKENDESPQILECKPFDILGYEFAMKRIWTWFTTWFGFTYLRPGYMMVKHGDTLLVNAHLTPGTGFSNWNRIHQIRELEHKINEIMKRYTNLKRILIGMDGNAHCDQPEIGYLENEMGFVDCWKECNPESHGFTWSHRNELTAQGLWQEPDQRIDYVWFKHVDGKSFRPETSRLICTERPFVSDHFGVLVSFQEGDFL